MFLDDISRSRKFFRKIHSFLLWLQDHTAQQFTFRRPIHIVDSKQQNFIPAFSDLLFIDLKKPLRNFSTCYYLELFTSLSRFSTNFKKTHVNAPLIRPLSCQKRQKTFKTL